MADPVHQAILRQGKSVWNRWREENPEIVPDLKQVRLRWASGKASLIRSRYIADFTEWQDAPAFERQLDKLERALRVDRE
jgi:hypothetical protein